MPQVRRLKCNTSFLKGFSFHYKFRLIWSSSCAKVIVYWKLLCSWYVGSGLFMRTTEVRHQKCHIYIRKVFSYSRIDYGLTFWGCMLRVPAHGYRNCIWKSAANLSLYSCSVGNAETFSIYSYIRRQLVSAFDAVQISDDWSRSIDVCCWCAGRATTALTHHQRGTAAALRRLEPRHGIKNTCVTTETARGVCPPSPPNHDHWKVDLVILAQKEATFL
jgi:hypothetical protein